MYFYFGLILLGDKPVTKIEDFIYK